MIEIGGLGTSVRNQVTALINDSNLRSILTLTPQTVTIGTGGGYEQNTNVAGTVRSVNAIPSSYVKTRSIQEQIGNIKEGEIRFLIIYSETIDEDDDVTFNSQSFRITEHRLIYFNEEIIAQSLTLSKELDS